MASILSRPQWVNWLTSLLTWNQPQKPVSKQHILSMYCIKWYEDPNSLTLIIFLAATKQLYDWFSPSIRLSVRLSVGHTFFTMFPSLYHHEIFRSYYKWQTWRPCKRSRSEVKVTEVNTQLNRFRTVTLVWIHIWWWNDAYSFMMLRRGALLFFKVIRQISRSHGSKKRQIWPRLGVSGL